MRQLQGGQDCSRGCGGWRLSAMAAGGRGWPCRPPKLPALAGSCHSHSSPTHTRWLGGKEMLAFWLCEITGCRHADTDQDSGGTWAGGSWQLAEVYVLPSGAHPSCELRKNLNYGQCMHGRGKEVHEEGCPLISPAGSLHTRWSLDGTRLSGPETAKPQHDGARPEDAAAPELPGARQPGVC